MTLLQLSQPPESLQSHPATLSSVIEKRPVFQFFEVGGCIRDELLGMTSKDVDFSVVTDDSCPIENAFENLKFWMEQNSFNICEVKEEFHTIRAKVPNGHPLQSRTQVADFVLARKDGPSSDGRHPDWVTTGTLLDDLSRRDFTVNAIARTTDGELIDPFNGQSDLQNRILRFVGDPEQRICEDGLRVLRGFRFAITKELSIESNTMDALFSDLAIEMIRKVKPDRIREELNKMLKFDSLRTVNMISSNPFMWNVILRDGVRLEATQAQ